MDLSRETVTANCMFRTRAPRRPPVQMQLQGPVLLPRTQGQFQPGRQTQLHGVAIVAQAQFWLWRELVAKEFQRSQGGAKRGELWADIYRGLKAACAGWGHLGPRRSASIAPMTVVIPCINEKDEEADL